MQLDPKDLGLNDFRPLKGLKSPWAQTVAGVLNPARMSPLGFPTVLGSVNLPDGDQLVISTATPTAWVPGDPIAVLLHGLTGSDGSIYIRRLTERFYGRGYRVVRVNWRGCGPGAKLAKYPYHCGRSDDLRAVLRNLRMDSPSSTITVVGVSLGANLALKMMGEDGASDQPQSCDRLIAVSPPVDLERCSSHLSKNGPFFDRYFTNTLLLSINTYDAVAQIKPKRRPRVLREFDEYLLAPACGFSGADEYYKTASAKFVTGNIRIPTLVLNSWDDPIICPDGFSDTTWSDRVELLTTDQGGHVGFLGRVEATGRWQWMDEVIERWVALKEQKQEQENT